jgi:hypothetical protein
LKRRVEEGGRREEKMEGGEEEGVWRKAKGNEPQLGHPSCALLVILGTIL